MSTAEQRNKVLEDIQRAKRLLKEGAAVSLGIHTTPPSTSTIASSPGFPAQSAGIGDIMMSPGMRSAMQALSQANMTSFGFFIPQDSHFGNSILPVLPRIDPPSTAASGSTPQGSTSSTASSSSA